VRCAAAETVTLRRADCLFGELPRRGKYALPPVLRAALQYTLILPTMGKLWRSGGVLPAAARFSVYIMLFCYIFVDVVVARFTVGFV